ncbi:MAG: aspartyl/asparaginyl beta-hydroxylase domain-containing protein [Gammaproteobacteria bacterium]
MDIDGPIRELGAIDATALREAILSQEEAAWHEDEYRQQSYDVHDQTQSIVLVFTDGSNWPNSDVRKEPGWDRIADVAVPIMHDIIEKHYPAGGTIIRAMAAKLVAGGKIKPHNDSHPSFHCGHRIHVPITTNPRVRFMIDGRPYKFQVGQAYELNNQKQHSVMNKGTEDRITFIFDYVPPGPLAYVKGQKKRPRESRQGAR